MDNAQGGIRQQAKTLFMAGVDRADPARALRTHLTTQSLPGIKPGGRYAIIAIGKAAVPMMRAALDIVPDPRVALAVTNPENNCEIPGATVMSGAHPVPDATSEAAGRAVIDILAGCTEADHVIALISGGGSALCVAPCAGLSLADKQMVNEELLASGLEINDMNLVRQQMSELKGGGFLHHAAPAPVSAYILSDVIGDDLRAIASGPTVSPLGGAAEARGLMEDAGIWETAPAAVQSLLSRSSPDAIAPPMPSNTLIGSNRHSLKAVMSEAARDWTAKMVTHRLVGDVADAAELVLSAAMAAPNDRPMALVFGGETTVRLTGNGLGGRNQEMALRVAMGAENRLSGRWVFLSGGTDGRDGPTDAAGGIVDGETCARIRAAGGDPEGLLGNNDSYHALELAGDLLMIGGTGTNVADLQIFLRLPDV